VAGNAGARAGGWLKAQKSPHLKASGTKAFLGGLVYRTQDAQLLATAPLLEDAFHNRDGSLRVPGKKP